MNPRSLVSFVLMFISFLLLQILFVQQISLFGYAFCFVYVACILFLPFDISQINLLLLGFLAGILIDVFSETLGMHAAATTLMAYCRPMIIRLLTPQRGYEERMDISLNTMEIQWMLAYIGTLTFIHHCTLFILEASNWSLFFGVLGKTIASTIFTVFVLIVYLYIRKSKRN